MSLEKPNHTNPASPSETAWLASYLLRQSKEFIARFWRIYHNLMATIPLPNRQTVAGAAAAAAIMLASLPAQPTYAATITVTTNVDEVTTNGSCSLREAISNSNADAATFPDCPAGTGDDVINLPAGTFNLTIAQLVASDPDNNLTINGAGAGSTIIHQTINNRVMQVDNVPQTITLTGMTLENGYATTGAAGGGIFSSANLLVIRNCIITGNTANGYAGGIYTETTNDNLYLYDSVVSNNASYSQGGGIYVSDGQFKAYNSTITGNSVVNNGSSGGVYVGGTQGVTIVGSTISNNSSQNVGGGVHFMGVKNIVIANSTISGNQARNGGAGIYNDYGGQLTVINSTITNNTADTNNSGGGFLNDGGGILNGTHGGSTTTLKNTIVAGNFDLSGGAPDVAGTFTASFNNLIGNTTGGTGFGGTDILNTAAGLLALANNGGSTQTHALTTASPAYNKGDNATCAAAPVNGVDQRGMARPEGASCDIGAFELKAAAQAVGGLAELITPPTTTSVGGFSAMLATLSALCLGAAAWLFKRR